MPQIKITISTDNAAFTPAPQLEVSRLLSELSGKVRNAVNLRDMDGKTILDANGNSVGDFKIIFHPRDHDTLKAALDRLAFADSGPRHEINVTAVIVAWKNVRG